MKLKDILRFAKVASHVTAAAFHGKKVVATFLTEFFRNLVVTVTDAQLDAALSVAALKTQEKHKVTL